MKAAVKPRTFSNPINGIAYHRHLPANRPHPLVNLDALAVILPYHRGQEIYRRRRFARHRCDTLGSWCLVASNIAGR